MFRASVPAAGDQLEDGSLKQYHVDKSFADRRFKVQSARTYFYLNEATCERNMETFIRCLEAIAGNFRRKKTPWVFMCDFWIFWLIILSWLYRSKFT